MGYGGDVDAGVVVGLDLLRYGATREWLVKMEGGFWICKSGED